MDEVLTAVDTGVTYPPIELIVRQTLDTVLDQVQSREDEEIQQVVRECLDELLDQVTLREALYERDRSCMSAVMSENSVSQLSQPMSEADRAIHMSLINDCIDALKLCIQRFPLHYKSYYRLAKVYMHDKKFKVLYLCILWSCILMNMGYVKHSP